MIPLFRLNRLSAAGRTAYIEKNAARPVYIYSKQWAAYWRHDGNGYTYNQYMAGIYTLKQAYEASGHCGGEKGIYYEYIPDTMPHTCNNELRIRVGDTYYKLLPIEK